MGFPNIIETQETDFTKNLIGIVMETIPGGSWGKVKLFKSFSEMVQNARSKQEQQKKEDNLPNN